MNAINRRDFSSRTVTTLAGIAAGAMTATSTRAAAVPGKPWRVAVIGHTGRGDYGHGLDVMWKRVAGTETVAVADAGGIDAASKRLPEARAFVDYNTMLREVRPDIVAVAPRHVDQHHAMCLAAVAADAKGIYVEKPFCRTPREANEIIAACEAKNVKLAVAHRNRYHPVLPVVRRLIAEGAIGDLLEARARGKEDARGGAQDLWVLGSHLLNAATFFTGQPIACAGMLYQDGRPCTADDIRAGAEGIGPIAGNELHARFEMANGIPLFFDSIQNRGDRAAGFGLQLIGTKGMFDLRMDQEPLAHHRQGNPHNPLLPAEAWRAVSSAGIGLPEPTTSHVAHVATHQAAGEDLIAAIEQDRDPLCDASAGRTTIEMIWAVFESHRQGGARIAIPTEKRNDQ